MDSGEWLLLGGLACCFLLLLDGYRRAAWPRPSFVRATKPGAIESPAEASSLEAVTSEPPSNTSIRAAESTGSSLIGRTVNVHGRLETQESLRIEGDVEGDVLAHQQRVLIGLDAKVSLRLKSRELHLAGAFSGRLDVLDRVVIEAGACLEGHLTTTSLHCFDGASLLGSFSIGGNKVGASRAVPVALTSSCLEPEFR
ncbi:bactofilin family protein [Salinicola socius]|uniref:Cell shape determination protein CcmA n=1 Tax=Salinicola socius TaxID=404433 RepID=A0A1Q8SPN2_9GAMM|nr:polymer-forming cytoskeletal protein [Salinicola socius]OLO03382.1 hypothetical protein BTW07_14995 [Salinicola socius]